MSEALELTEWNAQLDQGWEDGEWEGGGEIENPVPLPPPERFAQEPCAAAAAPPGVAPSHGSSAPAERPPPAGPLTERMGSAAEPGVGPPAESAAGQRGDRPRVSGTENLRPRVSFALATTKASHTPARAGLRGSAVRVGRPSAGRGGDLPPTPAHLGSILRRLAFTGLTPGGGAGGVAPGVAVSGTGSAEVAVEAGAVSSSPGDAGLARRLQFGGFSPASSLSESATPTTLPVTPPDERESSGDLPTPAATAGAGDLFSRYPWPGATAADARAPPSSGGSSLADLSGTPSARELAGACSPAGAVRGLAAALLERGPGGEAGGVNPATPRVELPSDYAARVAAVTEEAERLRVLIRSTGKGRSGAAQGAGRAGGGMPAAFAGVLPSPPTPSAPATSSETPLASSPVPSSGAPQSYDGLDGIRRGSDGLPRLTPSTVTIFRGSRPPSTRRAADLAADLFGGGLGGAWSPAEGEEGWRGFGAATSAEAPATPPRLSPEADRGGDHPAPAGRGAGGIHAAADELAGPTEPATPDEMTEPAELATRNDTAEPATPTGSWAGSEGTPRASSHLRAPSPLETPSPARPPLPSARRTSLVPRSTLKPGALGRAARVATPARVKPEAGGRDRAAVEGGAGELGGPTAAAGEGIGEGESPGASSPTEPSYPPQTPSRELAALLSSLRVDEREAETTTALTGASAPLLGTLPLLSPVREPHPPGGHRASSLAARVATPVRRSARHIVAHGGHPDSLATLSATGFSYAPNPALAGIGGPEARRGDGDEADADTRGEARADGGAAAGARAGPGEGTRRGRAAAAREGGEATPATGAVEGAEGAGRPGEVVGDPPARATRSAAKARRDSPATPGTEAPGSGGAAAPARRTRSGATPAPGKPPREPSMSPTERRIRASLRRQTTPGRRAGGGSS